VERVLEMEEQKSREGCGKGSEGMRGQGRWRQGAGQDALKTNFSVGVNIYNENVTSY